MACSSSSSLSFSLTAKPKSPTSYSSSLPPSSSSRPLHLPVSQLSLSSSVISNPSPLRNDNLIRCRSTRKPSSEVRPVLVVASASKPEPLKVMISGAPASGKGTQCEFIVKKYNLVHIAAGDLLRAEIAAGSENGRQAKEYMEKGKLVPDEIVVKMVRDRLLQSDSQENGWLLDGYPRSLSQATALKDYGFRPDLFILLEVPEEILVERVVGRRLDPVTGRIYHLKYFPPETEEIAARLTQRFDDTEEKVKLRLQTHNENVDSVLSLYEDITIKINGIASKEEVFAQIDNALTELLEQKKGKLGPVPA